MSIRILTITGLIALMVIAANGYLGQWIGLGNFPVTKASVGLSGSGVNIRAVHGWASANVATKFCSMEATDAAFALQRSGWQDDALARRTMATVRKLPKTQGTDKFCNKVWKSYGPRGRIIADLVKKKAG